MGCLQMERVAALSAVGNTPLVELPRTARRPRAHLREAGGAELDRLGHDRVALSMVEAAEDSGELAPGQRSWSQHGASRWR
jgi:cysteine synthase